MKRYILTFIYTFLIGTVCLAQYEPSEFEFRSAYSKSNVDEELAKEGYLNITDGFHTPGLRVKNNATGGWFKGRQFDWSIGKLRPAYWANGDVNIDVISTLINSKNANKYHCRIIYDNRILSGEWLPINHFRKSKTGFEYAYLGNFSIKNKEFRIQIERNDLYCDNGLQEFVIDNRPIENPEPGLELTWINANKSIGIKPKEPIGLNFNWNDIIIQDEHLERDSAGKVIGIYFSEEIRNIRALFMRPPSEAYGYQLYLVHTKNHKSDTVEIPIKTLDEDYSPEIDREYFRKTGKYEVIFVPHLHYKRLNVATGKESYGKFFWDKKFSYSFEVYPPKSAWFTSKNIIIGLSTILLLFAGFFLYYFRKNKRKLAQETQRKDRAALELKSIHAQLNPHFIFNALSSIQNLVNQNNIAKANEYLSTFSGLTRQILSNKDELISIADELKMLEGYLKMEQLRFGFQYKISIDSTIDVINAEIPVMLLQPFVENAIKHGVGSKGEKGVVEVLIEKTNGDLVIQIKDNGEGFDELHIKESSMGIKLCKERIKLLNQLHADAPVEMSISSDKNGTLIGLQLNGWA